MTKGCYFMPPLHGAPVERANRRAQSVRPTFGPGHFPVRLQTGVASSPSRRFRSKDVFYICSRMGFAHQQLRDKALLALEEIVQEARYRRPRRSFALRFALAYLWAYAGGKRDPFDELWRALGAHKTL